MMEPDIAAEARLRQMLRDAAIQIHPTRPAPEPGAPMTRPARSTALGLTIGLAVCLVVAAAITVEVHPWGAATGVGSGAGAGGTGVLVTAESDGAVVLLSPDTGAVVRTLVGASPVDSSGRRLGRPYAVTAANQVAYVAYEKPDPVIESIPFAGGTPHYVTDGMDPSANAAGTKIAFYRSGSGTATGAIVVRDLATGSEQTVDSTESGTILSHLSWSEDGTQLALSGLFLPGTTSLILVFGVQILALDQPLSGTNPRFVGTPEDVTDPSASLPTWTDAQFIGSQGTLAVLQSKPSNACQGSPTSVVSVDPATGHTRTLTVFPFTVSGAVFDQSGALIAYQRSFPQSCPPAPTTTTSTTTPGRTGISGSFLVVTERPVLYKWSAGTSTRLASNVTAAFYVASGGPPDRFAGGLRAAARAYTEAVLSGTSAQIMELQSPSCARSISAAALRDIRTNIRYATGVSPSRITVTGVMIRDVTGSSAEAAAQFDLPPAKTGNDNWITFSDRHGRWKVTDCAQLPIGGESVSASASAGPSPSTG